MPASPASAASPTSSLTWNVPPRPEYNGIQNHTIFLWTGIQQGDDGLIQAVLEWDHDHTGRYWTLACWIVNQRDQTYEVSPRIYDVYPGDRIRAEMRYEDDVANPGKKVWHIILTDETHSQTTELIDSGRAVDTNRNVLVFSGVLEGIGYVYHDIDLPGDVTFDDISYRDENGAELPIYLAAYADPAFPSVAVEYEDREWGKPVIIHTDYDEATRIACRPSSDNAPDYQGIIKSKSNRLPDQLIVPALHYLPGHLEEHVDVRVFLVVQVPGDDLLEAVQEVHGGVDLFAFLADQVVQPLHV